MSTFLDIIRVDSLGITKITDVLNNELAIFVDSIYTDKGNKSAHELLQGLLKKLEPVCKEIDKLQDIEGSLNRAGLK